MTAHTFVFTTEYAASYVFDPGAASSSGSSPVKQIKPKAPLLSPSLIPLQDIASNYRKAEDILRAVQDQVLRARPEQKTAFIAPEKKMEQSVAQVWQEVLGLEQIGIHDNFFEIGGTSLRAVQVISKLRSQLGVDVSLINMFEKPNIKALATLLEGEQESEKINSPSASRQRGEQRRANRARRSRQRNS